MRPADVRRKISRALLGHSVSDETRRKHSLTNKQRGIVPTKRFDPTGHKWTEHRRRNQQTAYLKRWSPHFKTCPHCNSQFKVPPSILSKRTYCSRQCKNTAYGNKSGWVSSPNERARKTKSYALWRTNVFQRDDYTCQRCKQRGNALHAHHDLPFAQFPDLRLELLNGVTLCKPCHRLIPRHPQGSQNTLL